MMTDVELLVGVGLLSILIIGVGALVWAESQPYEEVTLSDVPDHVNNKVAVEVAALEHVSNETQLDFLMPMFILAGDSRILIFIPILKDYEVYTTYEPGVYLAFKKGRDTPEIRKMLVVEGVVKEDKRGGSYAIEVREWRELR